MRDRGLLALHRRRCHQPTVRSESDGSVGGARAARRGIHRVHAVLQLHSDEGSRRCGAAIRCGESDSEDDSKGGGLHRKVSTFMRSCSVTFSRR